MAEAWRRVGIILGVSLIPFTALALLPLSDYVRFLTHNFLGFGIIGVLCAYYIRAIEADTSHKTFAFVLAICYGYAVGMVWNFAINTFDLARNPDQTHEVMTLAALLPITVVSFVPMAALMRYVRTLFSTDIDASVWWHMSILPAIPIVALLLGNLECVRSLTTGELVLDDGTHLPVSRRRQVQLRELPTRSDTKM